MEPNGTRSGTKLGILLFVLFGQCGLSGQSEIKDFFYTGINGQSHIIKVYFPDQQPDSRAGCAVFFHGGGWSGGSHTQFNKICEYLAGRGVVSITADYSLTDKKAQATLPEGKSRKRDSVIDAKSVIRWVKQNADTLGIDTDRIVAGGGSAGGHIATLATVDSAFNNPKDPTGIDTSVKALLLFCPAFTDLKQDKAPDVNVFKHIDKSFPPMLVLYGETESWKKAGDLLVKELQNRNADVENWMAPDKGHMFFTRDPWLTVCLKKADAFLVERGLLGGQSELVDPKSGEQLVAVE